MIDVINKNGKDYCKPGDLNFGIKNLNCGSKKNKQKIKKKYDSVIFPETNRKPDVCKQKIKKAQHVKSHVNKKAFCP